MGAAKMFLDEIPEFDVRDGTVHITAEGFELATPLRKFRLGMARAAKALASYDAGGEVVPMGRRKRGEH